MAAGTCADCLEQLEESREVNNSFPEALKEPILRRIQFSTTSRVDNLGMFLESG
jgi:hypothetical protein